jgi:hypothetical protein
MATTLITLERLLTRQHNLVTRAQLRCCGVTEGRVRAALAAGRWRGLNDAVLCTHNGPLTSKQAEWAAVLSAAPPTALCGLTAIPSWA